MLKAIKVRIYPSEEQIDFINRQLGCCRFVYNNCLAYKRDQYKDFSLNISEFELIHYGVEIKLEFPWLKDVHSEPLQQSVRDLNKAYTNFFKLHRGYPKFKKKSDSRQSCKFMKKSFKGIRGNRIDLIKALRNIHFKCFRSDERYLNKNQDKVSSLTLTKTSAGRFYISILIDKPNKVLKPATGAVGIDLGIKNFVTTSEGKVFENRHFKKSELNKLKRLRRQLSKKIKGSNNRNKARIRLAKKYEKITNRKINYLHFVTNQLLNENQVIVMEDLNVKGMVKNHNLVESIYEMNF